MVSALINILSIIDMTLYLTGFHDLAALFTSQKHNYNINNQEYINHIKKHV